MAYKVAKNQRIEDEWARHIPEGWGTFGDSQMFSGEREMLKEIMDEDEHIQGLVGGTYRADTGRMHKHKGCAVATEKRVIFLDKGVFGSTETAEIAYRNVESVTHSTGMMMAGVQITGRGISSYRIEDIRPKPSAKVFADTVRRLVEKWQSQSAPPVVAQTSEADELEKWAKLLRDGVVTQAEFDHKKRQILGL